MGSDEELYDQKRIAQLDIEFGNWCSTPQSTMKQIGQTTDILGKITPLMILPTVQQQLWLKSYYHW